jgi:hypothetical protein
VPSNTPPDVGQYLRVPGRLVVNPTNMSSAAPTYGGTDLGLVRDVAIHPGRGWEVVRDESFGVEANDVLDLGESWSLVAVMRNLTDPVFSTFFPAVATGAVTGKKMVDYPGSTPFRPGTLRSGSAVKLLFVPDDTERHRFVYFPKALPLVEEAAEIASRLDRELGVPVVFLAIRDASNRACRWALRQDVVL